MRVLHDHAGLQRTLSKAVVVARPRLVRTPAHLQLTRSGTTCSSSPCGTACKAASLADAPAHREIPKVDPDAKTDEPASPYNYLEHWWPIGFEK
jgi:hypothetical protein